jgi:hypothetical protein
MAAQCPASRSLKVALHLPLHPILPRAASQYEVSPNALIHRSGRASSRQLSKCDSPHSHTRSKRAFMLLCRCRWSRRESRYASPLRSPPDLSLTIPPPLAYIGFYFAVQSGGTFDVDYVVMDPDDKVLFEGTAERQGDYIFTANKVTPSFPPLLRSGFKNQY